MFKCDLDIVNVFVWTHVTRDTHFFFYHEGVQAVEQIVQRSCVVSVSGNIKKWLNTGSTLILDMLKTYLGIVLGNLL